MPQRIAAAVVTAAVLGCSAAAAQQGAPVGEWPAYGGDHGSTKYSPLDQIDRGNVHRLREAWRWASPDNPIVTEHRTTLPGLPAAFKPVLAGRSPSQLIEQLSPGCSVGGFWPRPSGR